MTKSDNLPSNPAGSDQAPLLAALRDARRRIEQYRTEKNERVAIVGMAGRFPGANNIDEFWYLLSEGRSGLRAVSNEELAAAGVSDVEASHPDYVRVWGGFDAPDSFDAAFFGYAPRDAEMIDPQQRIFLECAWSALEHAGYDSHRIEGKVGVFAGGALTPYLTHVYARRNGDGSSDPLQTAMGQVNGLIPARVSYHLDLRGPSCGVQTTCSTSLVAVHTAARNLLARECDMAIAGGVGIVQPRPSGYLYQREGIGSSDGICRPFDEKAEGTIFGNGVGAVILKRLSDALEAGDTIYGVILGSAVNNDGAGKVSLTAPSVTGQAAVLEAALGAANIDPATIDYVEAHGTATALGDPIEVKALNLAYGASFRKEGGKCLLGSAKGNIGHLDAAAGIAGLIKTLLAFQHSRLPATANFNRPNPGCDFGAGPFEVIKEPVQWLSSPGRARRAAISSFGIGGTNAHLIVEEPPVKTRVERDPSGLHLLPLSARTEDALMQAKNALATRLADDTALSLTDVAYTLQMGRRAMSERQFCIAHNLKDAAHALEGGTDTALVSGTTLPGSPNLAFVFSGQGSQYPGMAKALYETEPAFRTAFDACVDAMPDEFDIAALLYGNDEGADSLNRTEVTQPALFAVEYALAKLWLDRGLKPVALLGHSIGEYVAACLAEVFTLEDAIRVVCARGKLMQMCEPGAMLAVMLSETEAKTALPVGVEVAAVNAPRSCVLAGPIAIIEQMAETYGRRGIGCRLLKTSHAFHTAMMEPALVEFEAVLKSIQLNAPKIEMLSNVTGDWLIASEATDPAYWVRHLRQTVQFSRGIARLFELSNPVLLEVGPGSALSRLARQQLPEHGRVVTSLPDADSGQDELEHVLRALGHLWLAGVDIDWRRLHKGKTPNRVPLPTYAFERSSYWIPPATITLEKAVSHTRKGNVSDWFNQSSWQRLPALAQHSKSSRWLLLGGDALENALGPLPSSVEAIRVSAGTEFAGEGGCYSLDLADDSHYGALLDQLSATGWVPDQIINGFGLEQDSASILDAGILFQSGIALGKALGERTERPLLTFVGKGMHRVIGFEDINPAAAMALGLVRVLPQEIDGLTCRSIDISGDAHIAGLTATLLSDWTEDTRTLALRNGFCWKQSHTLTPLAEPENVELLRQGATYLVAGDLVDGLGLVYADALVRELGAKLILIGRSGLPASTDWDRWLAAHSPNHGISQLIRTLRSLGQIGRDYILFSGNLADADWVKKVVTEGEAALGPVHGIFHTAAMGEKYHCPITEITSGSNELLFDVKLHGIKAIEEAFADRQPAFAIIQSSLSSLAGGVGFGSYAAANSFLDAFADSRQGSAKPLWQAISWDACRTHATTESGGSAMLADAITPEEVWHVTRTVLARPDLGHLVVSPVDLEYRLKQSAAGPVASESDGNARALSAKAYVAPRDEYEVAVAAAMGELLGIERVGANDNFFELGGHSLLAIQVINRLRKQFAVDLPMRALLFEAPTVFGIAALIRQAAIEASAEHDEVAALLNDIEANEPASSNA